MSHRCACTTNRGFSCDDNGSLLTEVGGTYQYDTQDRLTQATKSGVTQTYAYDGDGNRVRQVEGATTTEYIVDRVGGLAQVVAEVNPDNTIRAFYVRGDDLIAQWRKTNGSETVSYYGYDGHGSTAVLTDSGGTATDRWFYDAWGNLVERDGSTVNTYRYTGQQQDGTGLYYLRARYYDPVLGRFGQRDPFAGIPEEPGSLHLYSYCSADPANAADPNGLMEMVETLGANSLGIWLDTAFAQAALKAIQWALAAAIVDTLSRATQDALLIHIMDKAGVPGTRSSGDEFRGHHT